MIPSRPSRFTIVFEIPLEKSQRCEILFKGANFGQAWIMPADWGPTTAGMWTFNRGDVAITHDYMPPIYYHPTLGHLIQHLEETFPRV